MNVQCASRPRILRHAVRRAYTDVAPRVKHGVRRWPTALPCPCRARLKITYHFFLPPAPPSSFLSHEMTLPSITTPLPSMKATRDRPSQFLKVSHTSGCCGWKLHWAISFDFRLCGSSIFLPPVSFPIFHFNAEMRQAARPQRTKPIGEYPTLISFGISRTWICASNSRVWPKVVSFLYTITSPERGMLPLYRPLMFRPTLSPGF